MASHARRFFGSLALSFSIVASAGAQVPPFSSSQSSSEMPQEPGSSSSLPYSSSFSSFSSSSSSAVPTAIPTATPFPTNTPLPVPTPGSRVTEGSWKKVYDLGDDPLVPGCGKFWEDPDCTGEPSSYIIDMCSGGSEGGGNLIQLEKSNGACKNKPTETVYDCDLVCGNHNGTDGACEYVNLPGVLCGARPKAAVCHCFDTLESDGGMAIE